MRQRSKESGQTTVEAAFALPILVLLVLLLVQPAIVLYDRVVMESAAAEACRLIATVESGGQDLCEHFVRRRLGAVPQVDFFHVHSTGCSWEIKCTGGASSDQVEVSIQTEVKPLPLIDIGSALLGLVNGRGNLVVKVQVRQQTRAPWAQSALGGSSPGGKVKAWCQDD